MGRHNFIAESLIFSLVVAVSIARQKRRQRCNHPETTGDGTCSPEVRRLRQLMASGRLVHPFLRAEHFQSSDSITAMGPIRQDDRVVNFTDLANALATCCCVSVAGSQENPLRDQIVRDMEAQHVLLILCDGMGNAILEQHLASTAFLRRHNQCDRLRAVFPSTTPAALTTLATAQWPGQHGVPGWELREQRECDYPGEAGSSIVQLRILAPRIMNMRNHEPANYASLDDVFIMPPWSRSLHERVPSQQDSTERRRMYINAYNGDDLTSDGNGECPSDFSSWQTGRPSEGLKYQSSMGLDMATIGETAFSTLGEPEGSRAALEYFRDAVDKALCAIAKAEACGQSTFTYLYTAHPDKHMHALGTDHPEVRAVVRGINDEIERLWSVLGNRTELLSHYGVAAEETASKSSSRVDASLIVTADHGHITVYPDHMIVLPSNIIECLEYANVGVLGKVNRGSFRLRDWVDVVLR